MGETVSLANARIEVEERPGYLLMVEHGTLRTVAEVQQYAAAMELLAERTGVRRALIDSRQTDATIEPPKDVRDAMWKWLLSARAFEQIAFVLGNEMHVARVNMTALSQRASIKAFAGLHEAHRWLTGRQRTLSQTFQGVTAPTIAPPRTPMPPPSSPYSSGHSSSVPPRTPAPPPPARARPSTTPPAMPPPAAIAGLGSTPTNRTGEFSLGSLSTAASPTRRTGQFQAVQARTPSQQRAAQRRRSDPAPALEKSAPEKGETEGDGTSSDET